MSRRVNIVGVDFSGAAPDNNTWMSQARLSGVRLDQLELTDCRRVSRGQVANELEGSPGGTVASLDFPFSVPRDFAEFWMPQAQSMPELWAGAARMDFPAFMALRDAFVAVHGESKRVCDRAFPECYSCLHKVNPNMVPMTFRGMQMLDRLWSWGCAVPPLAPQEAGKPGPPAPPVLLEAMPGAALKAMNLPYTQIRHINVDLTLPACLYHCLFGVGQDVQEHPDQLVLVQHGLRNPSRHPIDNLNIVHSEVIGLQFEGPQ